MALVGTGVENFTGFVLDCDSPTPCYMVETCGVSVGRFMSSYGGSATDANTTC